MASNAMASKIAPSGALPRDGDPYMGDKHIAEFRVVLNEMLATCSRETQEVMQLLRDERESSERPADEIDRCDLNIQKDERRQLAKRLLQRHVEIESALRRLDSGDYGYCEETGDEIGLARLRANPLARLCIEAATRNEHMNKLRSYRS